MYARATDPGIQTLSVNSGRLESNGTKLTGDYSARNYNGAIQAGTDALAAGKAVASNLKALTPAERNILYLGTAKSFNDAVASTSRQIANIYSYRGLAYAHTGETTAGINDELKAVQILPISGNFIALATAYLAARDYPRATLATSASIQVDSKNPYGYNVKALIEDATGQHTAAMADINKAVQLAPNVALFKSNQQAILKH
jgi:tetratricopeptide (TPR) repeat protein